MISGVTKFPATRVTKIWPIDWSNTSSTGTRESAHDENARERFLLLDGVLSQNGQILMRSTSAGWQRIADCQRAIPRALRLERDSSGALTTTR